MIDPKAHSCASRIPTQGADPNVYMFLTTEQLLRLLL